jgi:hypothetical protein
MPGWSAPQLADALAEPLIWLPRHRIAELLRTMTAA